MCINNTVWCISVLQSNTFQCVLATDGQSRSFAIFLYADDMIQWTTGDNDGGVNGLGGIPAQVGINRGDGVDFAVIPGSRNDSIINVTSGINIDTAGVYVIRISDGVVPTSWSIIICLYYTAQFVPIFENNLASTLTKNQN